MIVIISGLTKQNSERCLCFTPLKLHFHWSCTIEKVLLMCVICDNVFEGSCVYLRTLHESEKGENR